MYTNQTRLVHSVWYAVSRFPVAVCSCSPLRKQFANSGCLRLCEKANGFPEEKKNAETLQGICTSTSLCNVLGLPGVPFSLHTREAKTQNPINGPRSADAAKYFSRVCILSEDDVRLKLIRVENKRKHKKPLRAVKNILKSVIK